MHNIAGFVALLNKQPRHPFAKAVVKEVQVIVSVFRMCYYYESQEPLVPTWVRFHMQTKVTSGK